MPDQGQCEQVGAGCLDDEAAAAAACKALAARLGRATVRQDTFRSLEGKVMHRSYNGLIVCKQSGSVATSHCLLHLLDLACYRDGPLAGDGALAAPRFTIPSLITYLSKATHTNSGAGLLTPP